MSFTTSQLLALRQGLPRWAGFFHLETDPAVRMWLGHGDINPGANDLDVSGEIYSGGGDLGDWPELMHLFDGSAQRIDFQLAGNTEIFAAVAASMASLQQDIQGKAVHCGWAVMDEDWQLDGAVNWFWSGWADLLRTSVGVVNGPGPQPVIITLSAGTWNTGRKRQHLSFLTDADQKRRALALNPGENLDLSAERVALNRSTSKPWPP